MNESGLGKFSLFLVLFLCPCYNLNIRQLTRSVLSLDKEIRYSIDELKELARKDLQSKGYLVKWIFAHTAGLTIGVRHLTNLNGDDEVITVMERDVE